VRSSVVLFPAGAAWRSNRKCSSFSNDRPGYLTRRGYDPRCRVRRSDEAWERLVKSGTRYGSPSGAAALYSDAKEALADAIGLARRLRRA